MPLRCTASETESELGYYIRLFRYIHVHPLWLISENIPDHYQVLEENSGPVARSKGSSSLARPSRSYRVRVL
jgi:hypothetical protein